MFYGYVYWFIVYTDWSVRLSVCLSLLFCQSFSQSLSFKFVCLIVYLPVIFIVCVSVWWSVCLSVHYASLALEIADNLTSLEATQYCFTEKVAIQNMQGADLTTKEK